MPLTILYMSLAVSILLSIARIVSILRADYPKLRFRVDDIIEWFAITVILITLIIIIMGAIKL